MNQVIIRDCVMPYFHFKSTIKTVYQKLGKLQSESTFGL